MRCGYCDRKYTVDKVYHCCNKCGAYKITNFLALGAHKGVREQFIGPMTIEQILRYIKEATK